MDRRDFLRLSGRPGRVVEVSCETLYMRVLESMMDGTDGTTGELLERLRRELRSARTVRLHDAFWLERRELKEALEPLLDEQRARGGVVEYL